MALYPLSCDFVSRKVLTKYGVTDCFVLFFIHLESRKVHLGGVTTCPDRDWIAQQARNISIFFNEQETRPEHLLHDRDGKLNEHFDAINVWHSRRLECPRRRQASGLFRLAASQRRSEQLRLIRRVGLLIEQDGDAHYTLRVL